MLAYNLNAWLMLFNRETQADINTLKHTTLATSRLRFLFIAAKIWRHAVRTGVSYSDHYEEKTTFQRLMTRLRHIASRPSGFRPVHGEFQITPESGTPGHVLSANVTKLLHYANLLISFIIC